MDRGSRDSAAPSVRSSSIFGRGITRASRLPPPWTGLFASPSRRARRAVLCWAMPGSFDTGTAADAGSWRGAGKSQEPQGAAGRAGRATGQPAGPGDCLVVGICDPSHSLRRILLRNAVARVTHPSAPQGCGCGLGTPQGAVSLGRGRGCIYKLLTAQPAEARRQAGSRGLERACWSQPGIYYPASGCRAKVTVTNGLLHACHISSAHRVRLLRSQPCCAGSLCCVPSWGGHRGDPPFCPCGDLSQRG